MAATCVLQTRVDEATKRRAQKVFSRRGLTVSEGLRLALDREIGEATSANARLEAVFLDADKKREAARFKDLTIDSIVEFCENVKQQRAEQASEFQW